MGRGGRFPLLPSSSPSMLILFVQRPGLIYPRTFTILPSATSTTPFLHIRIWQYGNYYKVLIAPDCSLILKHSFILSLVDHFTWRQSFPSLPFNLEFNVHPSLYADVNGFLNPSIITGEHYHPDLLFLIQSKCLHVLE